MHTIVMRSSDGYSVKGFGFARPDKEFALTDTDCRTNIYGDRFTIGDGEITGIGNNVVIEFGKYDFTARQPVKLYITARSALPKNSVHLIVKGDTEKRILCEFEQADVYTERCFPVDGISGVCDISFGFLPGSDIDMKSFRFE